MSGISARTLKRLEDAEVALSRLSTTNGTLRRDLVREKKKRRELESAIFRAYRGIDGRAGYDGYISPHGRLGGLYGRLTVRRIVELSKQHRKALDA